MEKTSRGQWAEKPWTKNWSQDASMRVAFLDEGELIPPLLAIKQRAGLSTLIAFFMARSR
jgi:hypothetical protein